MVLTANLQCFCSTLGSMSISTARATTGGGPATSFSAPSGLHGGPVAARPSAVVCSGAAKAPEVLAPTAGTPGFPARDSAIGGLRRADAALPAGPGTARPDCPLRLSMAEALRERTFAANASALSTVRTEDGLDMGGGACWVALSRRLGAGVVARGVGVEVCTGTQRFDGVRAAARSSSGLQRPRPDAGRKNRISSAFRKLWDGPGPLQPVAVPLACPMRAAKSSVPTWFPHWPSRSVTNDLAGTRVDTTWQHRHARM